MPGRNAGRNAVFSAAAVAVAAICAAALVAAGPAPAQTPPGRISAAGETPGREKPREEKPGQETTEPETPENEARRGEPLWLESVAESVDCLRGVDANPLFAAVKAHMPSAEGMGLSHIDDRAKPSPRQQEILVRYAEAVATCIPLFFDDEQDAQGRAVEMLLQRLWGEQTALLRRLAEGELSWGRYNREAMQLDRNLRRELAAIRKPPAAPTPAAPVQPPAPPPPAPPTPARKPDPRR